MSEFTAVKDEVLGLLEQNKEWVERYAHYIEEISSNREQTELCYGKFSSTKPFAYYITTSKLLNQPFSFSMRFMGQEIATINAKNDTIIIDSIKQAKGNKEYFECEQVLDKADWNSTEARDFRSYFVNCEKKVGKSEEHKLESNLIEELSKTVANEKFLTNIQPVKIKNSLRFPMPTPISSSGKSVRYSGRYGGGIDILARCNGNLTVIELKDEYNSNEPPEKAMKQAIAYATFLHSLLRSEKGNGHDWYKFFGYKTALDKKEKLTINVVVAMPHNPNGNDDKSFANEVIQLGNDDKLVLHYMYLHVNNNSFEIKEIDTSLNQK